MAEIQHVTIFDKWHYLRRFMPERDFGPPNPRSSRGENFTKPDAAKTIHEQWSVATTTTNAQLVASFLKALLSTGMESNQPHDAVMDYIKSRNGKRVTKRDVVALGKKLPAWSFFITNRSHHATYLEYYRRQPEQTHENADAWNAWYDDESPGSNRNRFRLLIAYVTVRVTFDVLFISERNVAYFGAREDRNAKRKQLDDKTLANFARVIAEYRLMKQELAGYLEQECFEPDKCLLETLLQLR